MNLHEDRNQFQLTLNTISEQVKIPREILEKDYYVTLMLKELAAKQDTVPAFFKGGTALYKALGTIQRFSEDIDLTVRIDDCSNSQAKRRLERASQDYRSLPRNQDSIHEHNRKGSISCVYEYKSLFRKRADSLDRFGNVRIEATSFTVSEPTTSFMIAPVMFERATPEEQEIMSARYDIVRFPIETIRPERIFADKILASEFYYERNAYPDAAKHVYDITVMSKMDFIQTLLSDTGTLAEMIGYKRKEEGLRIGSDLTDKPFTGFGIFTGMAGNRKLESAFEHMSDVYVFDDQYLVKYEDACTAMERLLPILKRVDEL